MQKASETCRALLQLLINILPSFITLVLYIYLLMMHGNSNHIDDKFSVVMFLIFVFMKFCVSFWFCV